MVFPENVVWWMSDRSDGFMNIRKPYDMDADRNRELYFAKMGIEKQNLVLASLVHGNDVAYVSEWSIVKSCDALISDKPGIVLAVTVADCVPIYFYDKKKNVVAIAHAWWRWVVKNIVKSTIDKFVMMGSDPVDILVYVWPHIQKWNFEVKEDVASLFDDEFVIRDGNRMFVDMMWKIKQQLLSCGVLAGNIKNSDECTYDNEQKYFSYRRDKPEKVCSMVAFIGLKG